MPAAAEKEAATVAAAPAVPPKETPRTSLAVRGNARPDEVTVQFRAWTAHGNTAYQRGQFAGFPLAVAEQLERAGRVVIDPGHRRGTAVADRVIRK